MLWTDAEKQVVYDNPNLTHSEIGKIIGKSRKAVQSFRLCEKQRYGEDYCKNRKPPAVFPEDWKPSYVSEMFSQELIQEIEQKKRKNGTYGGK
jgi:hypothetical protein